MFNNGAKKDIETGVDKLLFLIETRKEISVMQAARELNVKKDVIVHWSDAMEEQGLIKIRQTLNECLLTSLDYYEITGKGSSLIKNLVSLTPISKDSEKIKKEEQIDHKLKLLDTKLKEFRGVKEKHNKIQMQKATIKKEKEELKEKQREFKKQVSVLLKKSKETEKRIEKAVKFEVNLKKKVEELNLKSKVLSVKEKTLSRKEESLVKKIARIMAKEEKLKKTITELQDDKKEHSKVKKAHKDIEKKNKNLRELLDKKKKDFRKQVKLLRLQRDKLFINSLELQREKRRLMKFAKLLNKEPSEKKKTQVFRIVNAEEQMQTKENKKTELFDSNIDKESI